MFYVYFCELVLRNKPMPLGVNAQTRDKTQKWVPLRNGGAPLGKWRGFDCQKQELKQGFWGYVVSMGFPSSNF